jgi:hypothetical protein
MNLNYRWLRWVPRGRARLADRVVGDATPGRVSRRDLIRGGTVVGLSAPLAGSIVAAGGGGGSAGSAKARGSGALRLDSAVVAQSTPLPISGGGTGQTTAEAAFNALAPLTAKGDMVYDSASAFAARLPIGTASQNLVALSSGVPGWVNAVVNVQAYGATGNGSTDDTAAIQAALNHTPQGGTCFFPMPGSYYKISASLTIPSAVNVLGPVPARPGKYRDASTPTPPVIKAVGAGIDAILTDTVYTAGASSPTPSSAITVAGLVIDGSGITGGSGHGIALCSAASSIENVGVQNVPGDGILFTDQNAAGKTVSGSMEENGVYKCNVYAPGLNGIHVTNVNGKITDGYIENCIIDFDFAGSSSGFAINTEQTSGWRIELNHAYACPSSCYQFLEASTAWIWGNYADNWGQAGVAGDTYYGFYVTVNPFGACSMMNNQALSLEAGASGSGSGGDGNFIYFYIENTGTGQTNYLSFMGQGCRQRSATGSGSSKAWEFNSNSGTLNVWNFVDTTNVSGTTISDTPVVTGTVNFKGT